MSEIRAMQDGIQELPEPTTPPIEKYGRWGLMRCSAETGMLACIDVVRIIDELIAAEAEKNKLSTRVDELLAEATKATEELARVREEWEKDKKVWGEFYGDALETANVHMKSLRKVERELARERELVSELRQVVKEYRRFCKVCFDEHATRTRPLGRRVMCNLCRMADALLETKPLAPEPVDSKEG